MTLRGNRAVRVTLMLAATLAGGPVLAQETDRERNAYFGETHIHTSWSVDAWVMGNRLTGPDEAYRYAQGQPIKHPMGFDIKIDTPLDFMGVTDHSEYVGVTKQANTPGSYVSKLPEAQPMIMKDPSSQAEQQQVFSSRLIHPDDGLKRRRAPLRRGRRALSRRSSPQRGGASWVKG